MNTRQPIADSLLPAVLNVSFAFRDDNKCFTTALENGFEIYTTTDCEVRDGRKVDNGLAIATQVVSSRVFGLVGGGKQPLYTPDTIVIWCHRTHRPVQARTFVEPIVQVLIDKSHYLISLYNKIILSEFPKTTGKEPPIVAFHETAPNPYGLCCLGKTLMVFLGQSPGQVWVVELPVDGKKGDNRIIPAHTSTLRALCLSKDEQLIATASEKGTIIRVFNTLTAAKIAEFRRGVDAAITFSLAFSPDNSYLAATSDKGTLHIFEVPHAARTSTAIGSSAGPASHPASSSSRRKPSVSSNVEDWEAPADAAPREHKWGALASVPIAPRIFRDTYSVASCAFDLGDEPEFWQAGSLGAKSPIGAEESRQNVPVPGWPGGRPPKGVIGWVTEEDVYVIGAGQTALWQSFRVRRGLDGKVVCQRVGWKRLNRQ